MRCDHNLEVMAEQFAFALRAGKPARMPAIRFSQWLPYGDSETDSGRARTTGKPNDDAISHAKPIDVLGQCCHITLSNGVEAFYLNGLFITDADPADGVPSLLRLARSLARASDCALNCFVVREPDNDEWAWNDVVAEIKQRKPAPANVLTPTIALPECPIPPRGLLTKLLSQRK